VVEAAGLLAVSVEAAAVETGQLQTLLQQAQQTLAVAVLEMGTMQQVHKVVQV
jgi:hypothetical protein